MKLILFKIALNLILMSNYILAVYFWHWAIQKLNECADRVLSICRI